MASRLGLAWRRPARRDPEQWTHDPTERADRPGPTLATQSREVIEAWAEERGGRPATVEGTERDGRPGVLRITFADEGRSRLQEIGWDDWFCTFEARDLVFIYQQTKRAGRQSTFFRLGRSERGTADAGSRPSPERRAGATSPGRAPRPGSR